MTLKLKAADTEDLAIMAACLQDAVINARDLHWDTDNQSFGFICQRYRWEAPELKERVNTRVCITGVTAARYRQITPETKAPLALLTIAPDTARTEADNEAPLCLYFADGAEIQLSAPSWACRLEDIGEPWPASCCPNHEDNVGSDKV